MVEYGGLKIPDKRGWRIENPQLFNPGLQIPGSCAIVNPGEREKWR
jgi:hypothetical protein